MQGKKEEEKETEGNKHFLQSYQTTQVSKKPLFISLIIIINPHLVTLKDSLHFWPRTTI